MSRYQQKVMTKFGPWNSEKLKRAIYFGSCPGHIGDPDQRRFRFDKWAKRPQSARDLYHRFRALMKRISQSRPGT